MKNRILIIIILVLVSSLFVIQSTFALYRMISKSTGSIATATWNVTLNQENELNNLSLIAGDENSTASYTVNITSTSQVDIIYTIVVNNIPAGVKVKLDNGEYQTPSSNKVIYADVSTINYSDENKAKSHTLTFKAENNTENLEDEELNINVIARQVLAN